jgi:hypothetical protein
MEGMRKGRGKVEGYSHCHPDKFAIPSVEEMTNPEINPLTKLEAGIDIIKIEMACARYLLLNHILIS